MTEAGCKDEATARQLLAQYFETVPPLSQQKPAQFRRTCRAYGTLLRLERRSLQEPLPRPLFEGDVTALVDAVSAAYARLLRGKRDVPFTACLPSQPLFAAFDPRRLPLALTLLLRSGCHSGGELYLWTESGHLHLRICGSSPPTAVPYADVAYRIVRLHGGRVLLCDRITALSLPLHAKSAAGVFIPPAAPHYFHSVLSPVCIGFYASPSDV